MKFSEYLSTILIKGSGTNPVKSKKAAALLGNHLNILVNVVSPTLQGLYHLNILVDPILQCL